MTKYSSKDVRVLKEIEHIQLNPGMYVGETSTPTHLIEEALDNALDEALAGYAKIIAVVVNTKENIYSVLDSGRGVPISDKTPVVISSKLFSGAKFQDKKSAYQISSGLHGVGLVAVNALSSYYRIEIYRNKKHALYEFENANLKISRVKKYEGQIPFSTKIEFIPNKKYFESLDLDLKRIRKRLTTASAEMANDISLILSIDGEQEVFKLDKKTHFAKSCLSSTKDILPINLNSEKNPESFDIIFTYENEGQATPKIISSVNLLPVDMGGSHVTAFYDVLREFFHTKGKKHGYEFHPNDALYRLRAYLMLSLMEPKFSGQTKEKLINPKPEYEKFLKDFRTQLESFFQSREEKLLEHLKRFSEYRRSLLSKKIQLNGASSRRAFTKFTKLRDCTSRVGELYIVEGESAGGSIIQSRNPRQHAILPLKGKSIPNITTKKNILSNKEVEELMKAIGTGLGPEFNLENLRYDKIICATDADSDGSHIACLVSMVIAILVPDIVKAGKYYIAQTPLFAINEGKTFIPLWNDSELEKARKSNRKIQRYKGLGEMNPAQLKVCLLDEKTRNLMQVSYSDNIEDLIKLFSSAEEKRKLVGD